MYLAAAVGFFLVIVPMAEMASMAPTAGESRTLLLQSHSCVSDTLLQPCSCCGYALQLKLLLHSCSSSYPSSIIPFFNHPLLQSSPSSIIPFFNHPLLQSSPSS